jgi:hypothetical protein
MSVIFDYASPGRSNSLGRVYFDVEGSDPEVTPRQALAATHFTYRQRLC